MRRSVYQVHLRMLLALLFAGSLTGCTPQEEDALAALQAGLSSLQANRVLTEQCVREVKGGVVPSDPAYSEVMEGYGDAREAYNAYLDSVENLGRQTHSRSFRTVEPLDVQNATADFLADVTSALKPSVNTRRIPFQRAVVIPTDLSRALKKLPKKSRERILDNFDRQVRWKQWSQVN